MFKNRGPQRVGLPVVLQQVFHDAVPHVWNHPCRFLRAPSFGVVLNGTKGEIHHSLGPPIVTHTHALLFIRFWYESLPGIGVFFL